MPTYTLPPWAPTLRQHQVSAIQQILEAFQSQTKHVILDAPTGSGKTLIADIVRQSLGYRSLYLCSSIALQTQFSRDFPDAKILKGRTNYPTSDKPREFPSLNAGDCVKEHEQTPCCNACPDDLEADIHCRWCHPVVSCPYEIAKREAIRSDICCTNTSYFLFEANYVGTLPFGRKLIIIDECDTLEDSLMQFVTVTITPRKAKEYDLPSPGKKTVESSWVEWATMAEQKIAAHKIRGESIDAIRSRNSRDRLLANIKRLNDPLTGISAGGWVYTGYDRGDIAFKPINVDHLAEQFLWRHASHFLLMSATTISFDCMSESLGIPVGIPA